MTSGRAAPAWSFDGQRLGREIRARREAAGYSTRQLARAAGVSQAYVVALERSVSSRDASGPCPTVEVLAGLASALHLEPAELLESSLRRAGPHVLHIVASEGLDIFDTARDHFTGVEVWLSAGRRRDPRHPGSHFDIHPSRDLSYRPDGITETIGRGFLRHEPVVRGREVGVVFSDTDSTMLNARDELLAIEHQWQSIVSQAAWAAGARGPTTVCVYEMDVLERMESPLAASVGLIESHDNVWFSTMRRCDRGGDAALRVLRRLRPPGVKADEWRRICARQLDRHTTAGAGSHRRAR